MCVNSSGWRERDGGIFIFKNVLRLSFLCEHRKKKVRKFITIFFLKTKGRKE